MKFDQDTICFLFSVFSLLVSTLAIFYSTSVKSYEILINERMKTYQGVKKCFEKIRGLIKKSNILKQRKPNMEGACCRQLRKEYNRLESYLSQTDSTEFYLMTQLDKTIRAIEDIYSSAQPCDSCSPEKLAKEYDLTFLFADIYCWTIWLYLQDLHKFIWRHIPHEQLFNRNFKKVYKNAKRLNQVPDFFREYPVKMLLGKGKIAANKKATAAQQRNPH